MSLFLTLLLAHLLADFPLQTNTVFRLKMQGHKGLLLHVGIHLLVTAVLIEQAWRQWPALLLLGGIHYLIDWAKIRYFSYGRLLPGFVGDQLAHLATLLLIVALFPQMVPLFPASFLMVATAVAIIPALLTLGYIWATDQCRTAVVQHNVMRDQILQWSQTKLLPLAQQTGWAIISWLLFVAVCFFIK